MTLIGYLHYRSDPRKVKRAYAYASVAKAEGIDFVYFTPGRVHLHEKNISGWVYQNGNWSETTVRFPDVIHNEATRSEKMWSVIAELRRCIPFTSHPIGDKMSVYERLYKAGAFRQYLIPTRELENVKDDLSSFIDKHDKVVLKPLWGAQGHGIIVIERLGVNRFQIVENNDETTNCTFDDMLELVQEKYLQEPVLVQKYITCMTRSGQPYDFRIHVQKDGTGRWVITSVYYRIACFGNITSNLSSGGYTGHLGTFLRNEFEEEAYNMQCYLEQFGLQLAAHLDEVYDECFDELGIDVGIDSMRKAWIYEVNWKPGPPPSLYLELDVVRNSIQYAAFLAEQHTKHRQTSDLQIAQTIAQR
ncbi:YheC/YheD family protein [Alicyclobacillus pomorum]|uniref:YheC/YheD family endospore coat-associated protein n=1 Tax=Alicyclobacillus pomorum TaxID=204470 RepID=UPI00040837EB|nr:YheC/YheD family protein [Alicyclobacillus pomorum]